MFKACQPGYRLKDRADRQMQFDCARDADDHLFWKSRDGGEAICTGTFKELENFCLIRKHIEDWRISTWR